HEQEQHGDGDAEAHDPHEGGEDAAEDGQQSVAEAPPEVRIPHGHSSSSSMSCSFRTVPTATAIVSPQMTHRRARRQSRGPFRVACIVLQPPNSALSMVPLKMNFRTGQRYRVLRGSTDSQMHYTGGA